MYFVLLDVSFRYNLYVDTSWQIQQHDTESSPATIDIDNSILSAVRGTSTWNEEQTFRLLAVFTVPIVALVLHINCKSYASATHMETSAFGGELTVPHENLLLKGRNERVKRTPGRI